MAQILQTLSLLAATTLTVYGCICYVGQELHQETGKGYGFSLAEKTPCECTEFRLGGVNMKPPKNLHEVKIGDDPRVSINDQGEIVQSPDCNDIYHGPAIPCTNQPTYQFQYKALQDPLTSPIRMRFTVPEVDYVSVSFSPNAPGYADATYQLYLVASKASIREKKNTSYTWLVGNTDINYFGEQLIITYHNGHFEVAIPGQPESTLTYDIPSAPPTSWFISFQSGTDTVYWEFFKPCISEFNQ